MNILRKRFSENEVALLSAIAAACHFSFYLSVLVRWALWDIIQPFVWLWDGAVGVLSVATLIVSVIVWFWVAETPWWHRTLYALCCLCMMSVLSLPLLIVLNFVWAIRAGI